MAIAIHVSVIQNNAPLPQPWRGGHPLDEARGAFEHGDRKLAAGRELTA